MSVGGNGEMIQIAENRGTWRNVCSSATLCTTNPVLTDLSVKLDFCRERSTGNRLRHTRS